MANDKSPASDVVERPAIEGLSILVSPDIPTVDVVFVHGFNGHPERIWLHKGDPNNSSHAHEEQPDNQPRKIRKVVSSFKLSHDRSAVYWPRDLLPYSFPHARVLTYGYDTRLGHRLGPARSQNSVYDFAKDFLLELEAVRRSCPTRPLLFIAHSLGGIIVKEMLRQSQGYLNHQPHLQTISNCTVGIIFFGTPHGGAGPHGLLKTMAENIARAIGFTVNKQILESLLPSAERLRQLRDEFGPMARIQGWAIHSFQEAHGINALGGRKVVEDASSCLFDASMEITQHLADNHMDMCRFSSSRGAEYQKVIAAVDRILATVKASPSELTQKPFTAAERAAYIKALRFDQIDTRHATIKAAHAETCEWLLKKDEYLVWSTAERLNEHNGLLWIKGKAGSGKSTMLKYVFAHAKRSAPSTTTIAFFFNARGHDLEKTTTSMYRSLLLQLFEHMPELQYALEVIPHPRSPACRELEGHWQLETLQGIFLDAIKRVQTGRLVCYVDALDECHEDEVRDMVIFFERLCQDNAGTKTQLRICFSSRHYPHISVDRCLEIVLEGQEGHQQDLRNYLESELRIGKSQRCKSIKEDVLDKANGIFLWLVLVVRILQKEFDRGRVHALQKRLEDIPQGLDDLFEDILTRDGRSTDDLLLCLQWMLFSKRPLKREELYYAILAGTEPGELAPRDRKEVTSSVMDRFILDCSKGLAELTTSKSKSRTVQFIHESVRDYFLKGFGLTHIRHDLVANFSGRSHEKLKECCHNYLRLKIPQLSPPDSTFESEDDDFGDEGIDLATAWDMDGPDEPESSGKRRKRPVSAESDVNDKELSSGCDKNNADDVDYDFSEMPDETSDETSDETLDESLPEVGQTHENKQLYKMLSARYPFLKYAAEHVFDHAEAACDTGIPQGTFIAEVDFVGWVARKVASGGTKSQRYSHSVSLLYVLAEKGLPRLVRLELERVPSMDIRGERHKYPIRAAIARRSRAAVQEFLRPAGQPGAGAGNCPFSTLEPTSALASLLLEHEQELLSLTDEPLIIWAFGRGKSELVNALLATGKTSLICQMHIPPGRRQHQLLLQVSLEPTPSLLCRLEFSWQEREFAQTSLDVEDGLKLNDSRHYLRWAKHRHYRVLSRHMIWQFVLDNKVSFPRTETAMASLVEPLYSDEDLTSLFHKHIQHSLIMEDQGCACILTYAVDHDYRALWIAILKHGATFLDQLNRYLLCRILSYCVRDKIDDVLQLIIAEGIRNGHFRSAFSGQSWQRTDGKELEFLLQHDFELGAATVQGLHPLLCDLEGLDEALAQLILEKEPSIFASVFADITTIWALESAVEKGKDPFLLRISLRQEMGMSAKTLPSGAALCLAAVCGHEEMTRQLLQLGNVDVNIRIAQQENPLLLATRRGHISVVKLLFEHRDIDVNAVGKDCYTPLIMAVNTARVGADRTGIVTLLLEREDIRVNMTVVGGASALWCAVSKESKDLVQLLLKHHDIDISIEGSFVWDYEMKRGPLETPLEFAKRKVHTEIAEMLQQKMRQQEVEV